MIFFILLSGFFFPIGNMPKAAQYMSSVNPVRYFMFALREMFLKARGYPSSGSRSSPCSP
jgi:ABC-2 type transport system permease protein